MEEAKEALVERIALTPAAGGAGVDLTLEGDLAGLLRLAAGRPGQNAKSPSEEGFEGNTFECSVKVVAGAGNRRILPALSAII